MLEHVAILRITPSASKTELKILRGAVVTDHLTIPNKAKVRRSVRRLDQVGESTRGTISI